MEAVGKDGFQAIAVDPDIGVTGAEFFGLLDCKVGQVVFMRFDRGGPRGLAVPVVQRGCAAGE